MPETPVTVTEAVPEEGLDFSAPPPFDPPCPNCRVVLPEKVRVVLIGPEPRSVTLGVEPKLAEAEMVNVPEPNCKYEPPAFADEQLFIAVRMEEKEVPAATGTVIPAWADVQADLVGGVHGFGVVSPSGNDAGNPAFFQSIAREGQSRFAQGAEPLPRVQAWACAPIVPRVLTKNKINKAAKRFLFISLRSLEGRGSIACLSANCKMLRALASVYARPDGGLQSEGALWISGSTSPSSTIRPATSDCQISN